ncbi:WD domain repeat-containing protein 55 [Rhizoclosmatium sp. JEL0117]|nr:WD domain repeat-containing protein 55 [Rhizoclosmatium sp. JEL0117]
MKSISFTNDVTSLCFHPTELNILAACEINGAVSCYRVEEESSEQLFTAKYHKGSCRVVEFSDDGKELYSGGKDKSFQILDTSTGKPILKKAAAHDDPINALSPLDPHIVVTGDEGGVVKIWDTRERKLAMKYSVNEDFISDFAYVSEKSTLLATSADGRLSVFDIRKKKPIRVSDNQEDELLSVVLVKDTKKAVVGSEDGILSIFSWDNWGDLTDRLPGHPGSIDSIAKLDESRILTGCSDGKIRLVSIFPNKVLTSLRDHDLDLMIERIRLNADGTVLASCSHENMVRFWDTSDLGAGDDDEDEEEDDEDDNDDDSDEDAEESNAEDNEDGDEPEEDDQQEDDQDEAESDDEDRSEKEVPRKGKRVSKDSDDDSESEKRKPKKSEPQVKKHRPNATQNAYFGDLD